MNEKKYGIVLTVVMAALLLGLSVWTWCKPADRYSESERRILQAFPEMTVETLRSGKFMREFETYTLDQFPCRDGFRTLKALAVFDVFRQKDNNDLIIEDGCVSKLNYPPVKVSQILLVFNITVFLIYHKPVIANWLNLKVIIEIHNSCYLCL